MANGIWVVFEGADGTGKTTVMSAVAAELRKRVPDVEVVTTRHPGSTPLGAHIRSIVKHPEQHGLTIGPLSSQMLMFTDHISFKEDVLCPALERGAIVLADRCDLVSGLVYGTATGVSTSIINAMMGVAANPRIDMLYILRCEPDVQAKRLAGREGSDRFEAADVRAKVNARYASLLTSGSAERTIMVNKVAALENITYVNTEGPIDEIARVLAASIVRRYLEGVDG